MYASLFTSGPVRSKSYKPIGQKTHQYEGNDPQAALPFGRVMQKFLANPAGHDNRDADENET